MRAAIALLALAFFTTGCERSASTKASTNPPSNKTYAPAVTWSQLQGSTYTLTSLLVDGKTVAVPGTGQPTIKFMEDGKIGGRGGVNSYFGQAELTAGNAIKIGEGLGATKMAGPPEAQALENEFMKALPTVTRIQLDADKLSLSSADGRTKAEFTK